MQITIEIDSDRMHQEIVDRVSSAVYAQAVYEVERELRGTIINAVRDVARDHAREILDKMTLPDGRTFRQYVEGLLVGREAHTDRPRLMSVVENMIHSKVREWASELIENKLPELKEILYKRFSDVTTYSIQLIPKS